MIVARPPLGSIRNRLIPTSSTSDQWNSRVGRSQTGVATGDEVVIDGLRRGGSATMLPDVGDGRLTASDLSRISRDLQPAPRRSASGGRRGCPGARRPL